MLSFERKEKMSSVQNPVPSLLCARSRGDRLVENGIRRVWIITRFGISRDGSLGCRPKKSTKMSTAGRLKFTTLGWIQRRWQDYFDVGQNGRPRGPQMEMSSLVLTIQFLGYLILTHTLMRTCYRLVMTNIAMERSTHFSLVNPWINPL